MNGSGSDPKGEDAYFYPAPIFPSTLTHMIYNYSCPSRIYDVLQLISLYWIFSLLRCLGLHNHVKRTRVNTIPTPFI